MLFKERLMSAKNLKFVDVSFSYHILQEPIVSSLNVHFSVPMALANPLLQNLPQVFFCPQEVPLSSMMV
jgi:hypothetical protein